MTADLDALDSLDFDFGCSFQAETGPNDTRTDTTSYLAPPSTHLEPPSAWITGKLRWLFIRLLVLGIGPCSLLLSNMTGLLPQRWNRPSHIIGTARNVEASPSQCMGRIHLQTQFWHPAIAMSFCTHSSAICIPSYGKFMVQLWHIFA
jgi:hypothetical protein